MIAPRDFDHQSSAGPPSFKVGQIVRHRRYGYRGVIVAMDAVCQALDAWYHNNPTQPDRDQPWYHILVDGADQCTYAAHSSLAVEVSKICVMHPWITHYFDAFEDGFYHRNDIPWPHDWSADGGEPEA